MVHLAIQIAHFHNRTWRNNSGIRFGLRTMYTITGLRLKKRLIEILLDGGRRLHVIHQRNPRYPACTSNKVVPIHKIPFRDITYRPETWDWNTVLLSSGRVVNILVVLAQATASLVLIVRRRRVDQATMLLDSTNGLYAIIGILCTCQSLMITVIGGTWVSANDAPCSDFHAHRTVI